MDEIQATESVVGTDNPSVAVGDTSPYTGEADSPPLTVGEQSPSAPDFLEVKFNKQAVTLSREDATRYAQKGMKYDTVEPLLVTLREAAAREGKTLAAWVEGVAATARDTTPTPTDDPTHGVEEPQQGTTENGGDALAARLAEDYLILRREVPEVGGFDTLPPETLREAAESGISLLDAYLRHEHRERCRIAAAQAAQHAAAAAAVGSQADAAIPELSSAERAMLRGVWG